MPIAHLASIATGRSVSLFADDVVRQSAELQKNLSGANILVIGGAGTIGRATIECLLAFPLKGLSVVDQDENGLTRLIRSIREKEAQPVFPVSTLCMHAASPIFRSWLNDQPSFSHVLNFAAVKHVRSEKQAHTVLHMIETNILNLHDLKCHLATQSPEASLISVSTDKAANPVSFMGATKRLMEHVLFAKVDGFRGATRTTRFANVAFSAGSLLESFVDRFEGRVPLAAPRDIKRYFVSVEEAGHLCLLAAILGQDKTIMVPNLDPLDHLSDMADVAKAFLEAKGYEAAVFDLDEDACAKRQLPSLMERGRYPLILTPSDSAGEKPYEEFVGAGEQVVPVSFSNQLSAIRYQIAPELHELSLVLEDFRSLVSGGNPELSLYQLKSIMARIEPSFEANHIEGSSQLDTRI